MTAATLTIVDQKMSGEAISEMTLQFDRSLVTLKDVISSRVETEVRKYNEKVTDYFNGLVRPTDAEVTLNGYRMKKRQKIDAEKQTYVALKAFHSNAYFVLVDDHQAESLDDEIHITPETKVSFIRLTPLVGG